MNKELPKRIGHYDIESILGSGGMSTVYKGIQPSLNRSVAIKVLPLHMAEDKELVERFERESSIIASMNHPNIIQIFDRGTDKGHYYIVMEHVQGCGMDELAEARKLPIHQIVNIARQLANGLEYAHSKGVVHRDIKPSNILISTDSGIAKITDFGIAKLAEDQLTDRMLTREQTAIGTADYMSPEQRRDSSTIDKRTDIFSFGVLLYEMLTGRIPVGRFRDPQELRDDTPPLLNQIVMRCLQEDRRDRYASFAEVLVVLNRLTQHGVAYREALARMSDSVFHIKKKAKTAFSHRVTDVAWRKRLKVAGVSVISAAVVVVLVTVIVDALDRGPSKEVSSVVSVPRSSPVKSDFDDAEDLLADKNYDQALTVLRGIRTSSGEKGDMKMKAEAQWRIAKIHEQRSHIHSAALAFSYFVDNFGKTDTLVDDDVIAEALFKAGKFKAADGVYESALSYFYRLRSSFPSYEGGEEAMFLEVNILDDNIKVSRSKRKEHRQRIARTCQAFCSRFPKSAKREEVLWRMAKVYKELGDKSNYSKAVDALEIMGRDFPRSVYLPLYEAAELARSKLKDKARARRLYQEFLRNMPDSDKADRARGRLKKL